MENVCGVPTVAQVESAVSLECQDTDVIPAQHNGLKSQEGVRSRI